MIEEKDFQRMLKAREFSSYSTCQRRKIGVYIPVAVIKDSDNPSSYLSVLAANHPQSTIHCCKREQGICPALHAEVVAVTNLRECRYNCRDLYIWAETPCHQCLSFIRRNSHISRIICLSTESYAVEYPLVDHKKDEIALRDSYAKELGFDVVKLDREEILNSELPSDGS